MCNILEMSTSPPNANRVNCWLSAYNRPDVCLAVCKALVPCTASPGTVDSNPRACFDHYLLFYNGPIYIHDNRHMGMQI